MNHPPVEASFDEGPAPRKSWVDWCLSVFRDAKYKGTDTTANRPLNGLNVGDWYYDTTLSKPIWVNSISPVVWKDAAGTTV